MKQTLLAISALALMISACKSDDLSNALYKDPSASVEKRVEDLLGRMTFEEKVWQLTQGVLGSNDNPNNLGINRNTSPMVGSLISMVEDSRITNEIQRKALDSTRLGIPVLMGYDVIHGQRTIYPIPLAQGASFNPELSYMASRMAAAEAWASGIDWTFSPMIDICHDPRWGRVMESYGEDPYVNSVFCVGAVRGYQGDDLSLPGNIAACLKHFVGYGASEAGRDYFPSDMSRQVLWDTYLQPYEAGVKAGAATLMSSFNTLCGIPASANRYTLTDVRKDKWGHEGFVVSDWKAIEQNILQGVAADRREACEMSFNAGVEMDMFDFVYMDEMKGLVEDGKIRMKDVDEAVRRVLSLKFKLGLFDNPIRPETQPSDFLKPEYLETARELAEESMVLLKNDGVLPLKKEARIALIGPVVEERAAVLGNWRAKGHIEDVVTIFEGMNAEFSRVTYAHGCDFEGEDRSGFNQALSAARASDVVVLCLGEGDKWTGEDCSRGSISLPKIQEDLFFELVKTGKPVVVILESGRPMDLTRIAPEAAALMDMWCPGVCAGPALANLLSGDVNPSGKLPITFAYTLRQVPVYYNYRERSRRGRNGEYKDDTPLEPLYAFGHGLSYSKFEYSDITLDGLTARVKVTNTSAVDGKETVLWFIQDPFCHIARPVKELKFFEKRLIKAGHSEEFVFEIDKLRDLGFVDCNGDRFFEPGLFRILTADKTVEFTL